MRMEDETVWLTQAQMAELFQTTPQNITIHIRSIYKEHEMEKLSTCKDYLQVRIEGKRKIQRVQKFYNLDVIISVGYRVKSIRGTQFRQWANKVLKEYLLQNNSVNHRLTELEHTVAEHSKKIDFFVRTSLPPVEGHLLQRTDIRCLQVRYRPNTLRQAVHSSYRQLHRRVSPSDAQQKGRGRLSHRLHRVHKSSAPAGHRPVQLAVSTRRGPNLHEVP